MIKITKIIHLIGLGYYLPQSVIQTHLSKDILQSIHLFFSSIIKADV